LHLHVVWAIEGTLEHGIEIGRLLRLAPWQGLAIAPRERHALRPHGKRAASSWIRPTATMPACWRRCLVHVGGRGRRSVAHLLRYLAAAGRGCPMRGRAADRRSVPPQRRGPPTESRRRIDWTALERGIESRLATPLDVAALAARVT
jgi:hypothetical protein